MNWARLYIVPGTPYAIQLVWSCHREIIHDDGPVPDGWTTPEAT